MGLLLHMKASSAQVNWAKSEALLLGGGVRQCPVCLGVLSGEKEGLGVLGCREL